MRLCYLLLCFMIVILLCARFTPAKALATDEQQAGGIGNAAGAAEDDERPYATGRQKYNYKRRRSPFGIVYKDGKPIGILEPISRIYEYSNFQDNLNLKNGYIKRDNIENPNTGEDTFAKRDVDNLDSDDVLRSFRMNPHFREQPTSDDLNAEKNERKRDADTLQPKDDIKGESKLSAIENNLKEIISDLNTISVDGEDAVNGGEDSMDDSGVDKREVQMEDEDLDNGANKIGLTKETHTKRLAEESSIKEKKSTDSTNSRESKKIADYRNEGESFIRQKRQQASAAKQDANDIVKGLEASGDLTVSGNKSPLASASAPVEAEGKKGKGGDFEKREKQTDDGEYEKRLQRNIQNKISEIKDQVKREIQALNTNKKQNLNANVENYNTDDFKQGPNYNEPEEKLRQKRNLLEQETSELDLMQNTEPDALVSHIRQKRSAVDDDVEYRAVESDNNKPKEVKRFARHIVSVTKLRRNVPVGFGPDPGQNAAPAKSPPMAQRAPSARDLKRAAIAAAGGMDSERLEKLLKESASLTESIKNERGARYQESGPHIEVELHGPPAKRVEHEQRDRTGDSEARGEVDNAALVENHVKRSSEIVRNIGKEAVVMKRSAKGKSDAKNISTFRQVPKQNEAKAEEVEALSDNSPAPGPSGDGHQYKAYEANAKLMPKSDSPSKSFDVRTKSPDGPNIIKWNDEDVKGTGEQADSNSKSSENGDLNKRALSNKVRQERQSLPMLTLEDMQALDSENNMRRRRRFATEYDDYNVRDKRSDYDVPNMKFRNYRGDEDEMDDESDEFDDDNFDDRTANLVRKRAAAQELENYDDLDDDYANQDAASRTNKRNVNARDYVAQMNDDAYDNSNYLYDANGKPLNRNKRQIFQNGGMSNMAQMAALHGGGPMTRHLAAIRGRNAHMDADSRGKVRKIDNNKGIGNAAKGNQMISGLSENDIFGALPQSYEGELTRFKRVKRDDPAG